MYKYIDPHDVFQSDGRISLFTLIFAVILLFSLVFGLVSIALLFPSFSVSFSLSPMSELSHCPSTRYRFESFNF